ncbi:uncharacterized protein PFL1_01021 [Pseudozyma flocculosa PF-1]|uniref:Related to CCC2 - copper resistance-associated P-type ATPase n=1 Tax=Pseudozyma flocculosa TaxID=84751 RepID=A0A5C3FAV2_9BASI|nr:uncharacterized protein PFL1_01021 [Pseudozyma flocculosa PF-1]EPQ31688.1 hypothetical protein PFL1_01021 [Pseudozyma flocculosa PF-1]SPO40805.1 related to CCC2 - copper resistance-associated P-type ATPase [Pseudozyma flocculosa]
MSVLGGPTDTPASSQAADEGTGLLLPTTTRASNYASNDDASMVRVRVRAVCPDIHCPSCISHLSSILADHAWTPASRAQVEHTAVTLIDRTVEIDLALAGIHSPSSAMSPDAMGKRAIELRRRLLDMLESLAASLAQEGYPIDSVEMSVIDPTARKGGGGEEWTTIALDAADIQGSAVTLKGCPDNLNRKSSEPSGSATAVSSLTSSLASLLSLWAGRGDGQADDAQRQQRWARHLEACASCQESSGSLHQASSPVALPCADQAAIEVAKSARDGNAHKTIKESEAGAASAGSIQARLAVGGMTCTSCVRSINNAVEGLKTSPKFPGELADFTFDVNLLQNSATFTGSQAALDIICEAVEDAGFDIEVVESKPPQRPPVGQRIAEPKARKGRSSYRATLAVKGMTCASCVNSLRGAVKAWGEARNESERKTGEVHDFNVNLLDGSATMLVEADEGRAEKLRDEIVGVIEDCGFDAEVISWTKEGATADKAEDGPGASPRRTARIRVDGMFCQSCIDKVRDFLHRKQATHADTFEVHEDGLARFSLQRPLIELTYASSPEASLRGLLRELNALDPAFEASYAPPPSLTSRSAALARKELRNLLLCLIGATLFAIPTLILSMIAPLLLSSTHPLNRKLNRYVWGSATLGEVLMWAIATPVQFGIGSIFFTRAYKSLAAVWRKGRKWNERLFRFGNMDVLVALGTAVAYLSSLVVLLVDAARTPHSGQHETEMRMTYFEVSVFLIFFILLGRVLESISKKKTGDAISELGKMKPNSAQLVLDPSNPRQGGVETIAVDLLEVGDLVLVPSGASPPLDGYLVQELCQDNSSLASAQFDESSLSGESRPVTKVSGDEVFAGTINVGSSPALCRIKCLPGQAMIDDILGVVREASGRKASIEQLADAITGVFVPCIVYLSLLVLLIWTLVLYSGTLSEGWLADHVTNYPAPGSKFIYGLEFAISCLLISCPCAIGLAAPTAQLVGIGLASKQGILVNGGGEAFRTASAAARRKKRLVCVFDKTGTITKGEAGKVVDSLLVNPQQDALDDAALLRCIDLAEQGSSHPLAVALRAFCAEKAPTQPVNDDASPEKPIPHLDDVTEEAGHGMRASFSVPQPADETRTDRFELLVGNRKLIGDDCLFPAEVADKEQEWQNDAKTVVFVATRRTPSDIGSSKTVLRAAMAISDTIRPEAPWVISHLKQRYGAEVWMVSGDNAVTAAAVARQVGIEPERVVAGVLPTGKQEWVERLQSNQDIEGRPTRGRRETTVCFVGDGINDSPALATANLGVALGSGSSIAHSSADMILLQRHTPLLSLPTLLELSRATDLKILTNFAWAFVFNVILIPLAAGVGVPAGVKLGPELSGLAMAASSTLVVTNSVVLRAWRVPKEVRKAAQRFE